MVKNVFNEKHVLFEAEKDVKEICKPVFELLDLAYFSYGRFYDNGKCILLSTNSNVFVNHFDKEYKLTVPPLEDDPSKQKIYNLILIDDHLPPIIEDEHTLFKHGTMLDILKKSPGQYEMFCFVAKQASTKSVNKFLNSLEMLDNFLEQFIFSTKNIMKKAEKQLIQLPVSMIPNINMQPSRRQKFFVVVRGESVNLTKRQYDCLSLIAIGKTAKEAARLFNVSYRTIEAHICVLKYKLNCYRQRDLVIIGLENRLDVQALLLLKKIL